MSHFYSLNSFDDLRRYYRMEAMDSSEVPNGSSQGVKRRRVAIACDACRTRKSRVCTYVVDAIQSCASRHIFSNILIDKSRSVMELVHDVQYASI